MTRPQDVEHLVPDGFRQLVRRFTADDGAVGGPSGAAWSERLPRLLADVLDDWALEPAGVGRTGWTSVVVPVRRDGVPHVLKLVWPHVEARAEALALRHWDGRGAVRLVQADPTRWALLLEPLDADRDLRGVEVEHACEVAGTLLRRLHVPSPPGLRRLSDYALGMRERLRAAEVALPRRVVDRALSLVRELTADPGCDATLLHTDLHFENVLAGEREPWLAIDPKPMAGHPAYEVHPLLRNRVEELGSGSAFRWSVRRRLEVVSAAAGIDEDLARLWTVVDATFGAVWAAEEGDREAVTFAIALVKALED